MVSASSPDVALLAEGGLVVVIDLVDGREVVVFAVLGGALAAGRSAVSLVNGLDIAIAVTTSAAPTAVSSRQDPSNARQSLPTGIPRGFATSQTASATAAGVAGQIRLGRELRLRLHGHEHVAPVCPRRLVNP